MGVSDSFQKLIAQIAPLPKELERAAGHRASIESRLASSFNLNKFLSVGSHSRETAVRRYSDIDLFGVFKREDFRRGDKYVNSNTAIDNLRKDLAERFWQTSVYKDGPAVVVSFGQGDYSVDVVPAMFWEIDSHKRPIYYMPNGTGEWMKTSPESHNRFIREADERSGYKLRRTVQMMKYWRECRTPRIPISSFHLDLLLANERICEGVKSYSQCLTEAFQLLTRRDCSAYLDPLGISGYVSAVKMGAQRDVASRSVANSAYHGAKALEAERNSNQVEAVRQWDIVFNTNFPK